MNHFKLFGMILMMAASACTLAEEAVAPNALSGKIIFSEKEEGGGRTCSIPIEPGGGQYKMADTLCKNDTVSFFMLDSVSSAVTFTLNSEASCSPHGDWHYMMKTYIQPTTTVWINTTSLDSHPSGDIIKAGLRMVSPYHGGGNVQGKLSCVDIIPSPQF